MYPFGIDLWRIYATYPLAVFCGTVGPQCWSLGANTSSGCWLRCWPLKPLDLGRWHLKTWNMAHRNRWFTYETWWFSMAMLNNQMVGFKPQATCKPPTLGLVRKWMDSGWLRYITVVYLVLYYSLQIALFYIKWWTTLGRLGFYRAFPVGTEPWGQKRLDDGRLLSPAEGVKVIPLAPSSGYVGGLIIPLTIINQFNT